MLTTVTAWVLGLLALASGALVFRVNSMARATFLLLASFLAVGGELLLLSARFLGGILILMLTGEMVIMAVFMIMYMMNPAGLTPMRMVHNQRGAAGIALAVLAGLAAGILLVDWPAPRGGPPADDTVQLGRALFGSKMLAMMTMAVGLFAAMVAATVLVTHRGRYDRYGDELDAERPDDPVPGGVGR
jgi:NADH:ubiquinone oxidoreductase subunit 6 (subunit J)